MSDIHALSGAYAVDALDDIERAQFERHLAECPECRAEVASFRETSALLAEPVAEEPPTSLRAGVLAEIGRVRPLPPETPARTVVRRRVGRWLAAAAAVVLVAVGVIVWHPWQSHQASLADQILNAPDAVRTIERVPHGGTLTLVRSPSLGRAVMIGHGVADPHPGTTYELWLQQPGHTTFAPAGLMPDPHQPTVLQGDAGTATAAAVSVEPEGGSPQPTTNPIAVFTLTH
jgi:anti-sigma-K factor RskA